jgi:hypothetical protein
LGEATYLFQTVNCLKSEAEESPVEADVRELIERSDRGGNAADESPAAQVAAVDDVGSSSEVWKGNVWADEWEWK